MDSRNLAFLIGVVLGLLFIYAGEARAHGTRNTADGPDAGDSIQFYAGERLADHLGFWRAVDGWNSVPGPRLERVQDESGAEVIAYMGICTFDGRPWYGGTAKRTDTVAYLCISPTNARGDAWSERWMKRLGLHEWGHLLGMPHHYCGEVSSIMNVCSSGRVFHLTEHDRAYKRSL